MSEGFSIKPLALKQIDQAFTLVRTMVPEVSQERWRDFAAALMVGDPPGRRTAAAAASGVMTVQNSGGYILGLFCYRTCDHLRHGSTLMVDNLIVVDLFDAAGILEILLSKMDGLAQDLGCLAIHTDLPPDLATMPESCRVVLDGFRRRGGTTDAARLLKLLGPPPCRPLSATAEAGRGDIANA